MEAERKPSRTLAQLGPGARTQTSDWQQEIAATRAWGRGEFKAAFPRPKRRAAIGRRLPPFVGAPCVAGVRGGEERRSDAEAPPANQRWGRGAKKEADPLPRS